MRAHTHTQFRQTNETDHLASVVLRSQTQLVVVEHDVAGAFIGSNLSPRQGRSSPIHLCRLGRQLKRRIKSDCIPCPEEALPAILRGLINMAAVGRAERCHRQLKNNGDIINLNVLYLEWRRFYNHYCDGPGAAGCAKGKGWMTITLFLLRPPCAFF